MVIGLNRDLKGKPTGTRTLALVSVAAVHHGGMEHNADALSRVIHGIIQGIMAGVGFIGAGVILRDDRHGGEVRNLTTAATVWITAALGIACALAAWGIVGIGVGLTLFVLVCGGPIERLAARLLLPGNEAQRDQGDDDRPAARRS